MKETLSNAQYVIGSNQIDIVAWQLFVMLSELRILFGIKYEIERGVRKQYKRDYINLYI